MTAAAAAAAVLLLLHLDTVVPAAGTACSSPAAELRLVVRALGSVSGFDPTWFAPPNATIPASSCLTDIRFPSRNLTGIISWNYLRNLTGLRSLDLSSNNLQGSVPAWLFSSPALLELDLSRNKLGGTIGPRRSPASYSSLRVLNLSRNRFTSPPDVSFFPNLTVLDLSHNELRVLPPGFSNSSAIQHLDVSGCRIYGSIGPVSALRQLNYLDVSNNKLFGRFPSDFPSGLSKLGSLNISHNNFTGLLDPELLHKFGESAFTATGIINGDIGDAPSFRVVPAHHYQAARNHTRNTPSRGKPTSAQTRRSRDNKKKILILGLSLGAGVLTASALACLACCAYRRRRNAKRRQRWAISKPCGTSFKVEKSGPFSFETESGTSWVADVKEPTSAPVVMFEKPLLALTFKDLIAATSGFGKESLLAEGGSGPVYRAVLQGDLHVTIKVLDGARGIDRGAAVAEMESLAKLKHPNLLTISGYCIAGKEKLVLHDYMPNGDLHQFLHELPAGAPNVEDWTTDTWEHPAGITASAYGKPNWPTRHHIALGVARGLAYLHHAGSVHGRLTSCNVLLTDGLDPRIAGFGVCDLGRRDGRAGAAGPEGDVYDFGALLMELLTGREGGTGWARRLVREGRADDAVEPGMRMGREAVGEVVACMKVGYLCTAESPGKRPTMQQVVGLLKDIRPD
ncbi:hypothetical protein MLD38_019292 [Melastoma candidum]|uniref:Uncharacterized protein n=1 Tax=Melastoma candidum TaxID=119954 RepID=A0ACB9R0K9_9MYRT|nr:hypothetical protein MLD38_019292 [Melastoma candidum]